MPLTPTLSEGVLPAGTEKQAFIRLSEAMQKWHGLTGNAVMTPNVTGTIHVLPKGSTFSGLEEVSAAWLDNSNCQFSNWRQGGNTFKCQEKRFIFGKS